MNNSTQFLTKPILLFSFLMGLGTTTGCLTGELTQPNQAPISDAGFDQVVYLGSESSATVFLEGRASCDPNGYAITSASWSLLEAPGASTLEINTVSTLQGFFEATSPGIYLLSLQVTANDQESNPDFVEIIVREGAGDDDTGTLPTTDACGNTISGATT